VYEKTKNPYLKMMIDEPDLLDKDLNNIKIPTLVLAGEYDVLTLKEKGIFATRQLAKRQLTWLRAMQDTQELDCLDTQMNTLLVAKVQHFLAAKVS